MTASESTTHISAMKAAVGLYVVLFTIKLAAFFATGVMALLSYKLYEEAIPRLFPPAEITFGNLGLALAVIVGSMAVAAAPLGATWANREGADCVAYQRPVGTTDSASRHLFHCGRDARVEAEARSVEGVLGVHDILAEYVEPIDIKDVAAHAPLPRAAAA